MFEDVREALRSVVAIPVTPFDDSGGFDGPAYGALVARMVQAGITTLTPNGNTGEFYSLSPEELSNAVAVTVEAAPGAMIVAGVGHDAARAAELARDAGRLGAQAVMVHQPVHPYQSPEGWIAYHRTVADAVPDLAVVCYIRNTMVTAGTLNELTDACPNVVGVKYAVPDVIAFGALAGETAQLTWVCGLAESWAPFYWVAGAEGFTSGLVSIAPELSLELLARLRERDLWAAMDLWRRLKPIEDLRARHANGNNVSVVKEALAQLGLCGRTVRPPISELPGAERAEVTTILQSLRLPLEVA